MGFATLLAALKESFGEQKLSTSCHYRLSLKLKSKDFTKTTAFVDWFHPEYVDEKMLVILLKYLW